MSFSGTGIVTTAITSADDSGISIAAQANNKIVVSGVSNSSGGGESEDVAIVRYNSDGRLDTSFKGSGIVTTPISSGQDYGWAVAIQPDGKIVVAGFSDGGGSGNGNFAVVRYLGDGANLALTKVVDNNTPAPGQRITYTLRISNSGSISANNAAISDTLPGDLMIAGAVTLDPPDAGITGFLPTLVSGLTIFPNQYITVTFPVTVGTGLADGLTLINVAAITSTESPVPIMATAVITLVVPDTQPPSFPAAALITPAQSITVTMARPTFDWKDASDNVGVVSYTLILTGSTPFTGDIVAQGATTTFTTTQSIFTPTADLPNAVYTWTVSAHDAAGYVTTAEPPENFTLQKESSGSQPAYLPIILKE